MNIMGMGSLELVIIAVAALLIFGPDRLPEVAGQVGKFVRDIRKMTGDLTGELERTAGVGDIKKAVQQELGGIQNTVNSATKGISSGVSSSKSTAAKPSTTAGKGTTTAAKSTSTSTTTAAKPATTAAKTAGAAKPAAPPKPVASKKDPLADVSFYAEASPKVTTIPASNSAQPEPVAATLTGNEKAPSSVIAPLQMDALGRARQRRMAAGYNRTAS